MAKTSQNFAVTARMARDFAISLAETIAHARRFDDSHTGNDYSGASADPTPGYINVDADGNIDGLGFEPEDYGYAINAALQMLNFWENRPVVQGDYRSTLSKLIDAKTSQP